MKTIKNILTLLTICLFILFAIITNVHAGYSGSSPTWTTTPDYASVNGCINAASAGDTINVLEGTATWNNTLTITKGIKLIGAGVGKTIIKNATSGGLGYAGKHCWKYEPANYNLNTSFRISGFTIDLDNKAGWLALGYSDGKRAPFTIQTKVRIDHNSIINARNDVSAAYIWDMGHCYGVVDNNNFSGAYYGFKSDPQIVSSYAWYTTSPQKNFEPGSEKSLYFDDNTMSLTTGDNLLFESQYGGRYVARYNTITGAASSSLFEAHGHQGTGTTAMPAVFGIEVYGNRITNTGGNLAKVRGGKSFVFYNSVVGGGENVAYDSLVECPSGSYDDSIAEMIHDTYWWRSRSGYTGALISAAANHTAGLSCNGLSNIPTLGRDVISDSSSPADVGCGTTLPGSCVVGDGFWLTTQSCADLTGLVGAAQPLGEREPASYIEGTLYKCTATNEWTEFYKPLEYPHPLRAKPEPPVGLKIN
jgi:hypothetical protein